VTHTTFLEHLLTSLNVHEILGFEILSSEKHFCRWEISEILLRVRGLDPWGKHTNLKHLHVETLSSSVYDIVYIAEWDIWALDVEKRPEAV